MSITALYVKHERRINGGQDLLLQEHANRKARENPNSEDKARGYQSREFTVRFDDSQLIPPPRLKGARLGSMVPHGLGYEY